MGAPRRDEAREAKHDRKAKYGSRTLSWWARTAALALAVVVLSVVIFAIYHAEPILKGRIIETLSVRFHGRVELTEFRVSVSNGFQVSGAGLKILDRKTLMLTSPEFSR